MIQEIFLLLIAGVGNSAAILSNSASDLVLISSVFLLFVCVTEPIHLTFKKGDNRAFYNLNVTKSNIFRCLTVGF